MVKLKEGDFLEIRDRRRRRKKFSNLFSVVLTVVFLILGGWWLVFRSPIANFDHLLVEIEGDSFSDSDLLRQTTNDEIIKILRARIFNGNLLKSWLGFNNFLAWPNKLTEEELSVLPALEKLEIEKKYRDDILILKIKEREPFGVWCFNKQTPAKCFWFSSKGIIFEEGPVVRGSLVVSVNDYYQDESLLGLKILPDDFLENIFSIFSVIKDSNLSLKEMRLNDLSLQEVEVKTYEGPSILFSLRFSALNTLEVIRSLAAKSDFGKLEYVDFRVENRAYYK